MIFFVKFLDNKIGNFFVKENTCGKFVIFVVEKHMYDKQKFYLKKIEFVKAINIGAGQWQRLISVAGCQPKSQQLKI